MKQKILQALMAVAVVSIILSFCLGAVVITDYSDKMATENIKNQLVVVKNAVELNGEEFLKIFEREKERLTLINPEGQVLYDTNVKSTLLENHKNREEVIEAFNTGVGSAKRYSDTLLETTLYEATLLSDGNVLRIAITRDSALVPLLNMILPMGAILIVTLIVSLTLSKRLAKRITEPLNSLDLENPLSNNIYDELLPLLARIHTQQLEIKRKSNRLKQERDEFAIVSESMKEGLIVLDNAGRILSINKSAKKIFSVNDAQIGGDFLTIERRMEVGDAIEAALETGHSDIVIEKSGHIYRLIINQIKRRSISTGTVIIVIDITEKVSGERLRREFSANVSHELKTPLQSILGSAELIENGIVLAEDTPKFAGQITTETRRLISLIEDIIRLSELDERVGLAKQSLNLDKIAADVISAHQKRAATKNVSVTVTGTAELIAVESLIYDIIYNLSENAIKYNTEGGRVDIVITEDGNNAVITVSDTGIGIPKKDKDRVFERFYRVDKSHSKKTGGTGLGLSIVKHAVLYHGGKIKLSSKEGKGTKITVTLPKE